MKYILGIDQGGTKTLVALSDTQGNILACETSYGSCHSYQGMPHAMNTIKLAFDRIKNKIDFSQEDLLVAICGLTGADFKFECALLKDNIAETLEISKEKIQIENDSIIALRGGTNSKYGAVICAGTGLNCAFINKAEQKYIQGYYISDEHQGASSIGRKAMVSVFDAESGFGKKTLLTDRVLAYFNISGVDALLRNFVFDNNTKLNLKHLTPLVFELANEGDEVCNNIVAEFAQIWARYIVAGAHKLQMYYPFDIIFSGGVFKEGSDKLVNAIIDIITSELPAASIVSAEYEPIIGAIRMGLDVYKEGTSDSVEKNIKDSAEKMNLLRTKKRKI